MSIAKYRAFLKVVELGSLTKAAKELGYSQPNISHMIRTLEDEFGIALFTRNKDKCILTKNAESILYYCTQIVNYDDQLHASVQGIHGMLTGNIRIGATNSTMIDFVPKVIHRFTTAYSAIELFPTEMDGETVVSELKKGTIDIGFLEKSLVPDDYLDHFIPLFTDPICLILPPNHPLAALDKIPLSRVKGCDFILPISQNTGETRAFNEIIERMSPNIKYRAASDLAIFGMVENNLGISIMSKEMTKYLRCQVIARDFMEDFHRTQGALVPSFSHLTPAAKEFISIAQSIEVEN